MARHGSKPRAPASSRPPKRSEPEPATARSPIDHSGAGIGQDFAHLAERLRRLALGLTAALITARAFFPSEPNLREGAGDGLSWVRLVLVTVGIALAVPLLGGRFRFRFSVADALVVATMTLVAVSASHTLDRRPAISLAWEWIALGFVYLLLRNLPRTRGESSVLAGALVATAVAVSAYGLYQVKVELPLLQAEYQRNPRQILQKLNIEPGTRGELMLKSRLLGSTEPWSTFGLPNSLAGYIAGPFVILLAVGLYNLVRPDAPGSRWTALAMAAPSVLIVLVCLILGKSRSAQIGVAVSLCLLAVRGRRLARPRTLLAIGLSGAVVVAGVVIAGLATRRLDLQVLTQSPKSLRYRIEYWRGAWGVITEGAPSFVDALSRPTFWWGVGPGNFAGPYLKYKLPEASEEILDPHNMFFEVWASGGFWALVCLAAALGCAFWNLLGPPRPEVELPQADDSRRQRARRRERKLDRDRAPPLGEGEQDDQPPSRTTWLMIFAGAGWLMVVLFVWLNPFQTDLFSRWLILGASWLAAALLIGPLWKRLPVPALALGAGALAVVVNLLAQGGIGIPTVALGLWTIVALGLNLRDDRPCSRIREYDSRMPALGLAVAWSAIFGTFIGMVSPFWRSEAAIARGEAAVRQSPPDFEEAEKAFELAATEDGYSARPWLSRAALHWMIWRERGSKVEDLRWMQIPICYDMATAPPRNPRAWAIHSERAARIHDLMREIGSRLDPLQLTKYRGKIVEATRTASRLNPTNSELHARLAQASAEIHMFSDAVTEANEALRLDRITPHADRKLREDLRLRLEDLIPKWRASADKMPTSPTFP
jgi:O-antigen ligase